MTIHKIQYKNVGLALGIVLPLLAGGIIYYVTSPNVWFVKTIDELLGIKVRSFSPELYDYILLRLLRFYFLDFLWAFAFSAAMQLIVRKKSFHTFYITVPTILGGGLELLQHFEIVKGTFDPWDIAVECAGACIGTIIFYKIQKEKKL